MSMTMRKFLTRTVVVCAITGGAGLGIPAGFAAPAFAWDPPDCAGGPSWSVYLDTGNISQGGSPVELEASPGHPLAYAGCVISS